MKSSYLIPHCLFRISMEYVSSSSAKPARAKGKIETKIKKFALSQPTLNMGGCELSVVNNRECSSVSPRVCGIHLRPPATKKASQPCVHVFQASEECARSVADAQCLDFSVTQCRYLIVLCFGHHRSEGGVCTQNRELGQVAFGVGRAYSFLSYLEYSVSV
ncbi:hypothetical protein LZ31DRAFT_32921 [Colletotrichum somersetense]|nr:hypothetical protein LZ31DRAFT_32921 [Colletotrichum somersetense]